MPRLLSSAWGSFVWGGAPFGAGFELPECLILRDNNTDHKVETWNLTFADGSRSTGTEVKDRRAILEGTFGANTRAEFRTYIDSLRYACSLPNQKLQIVDNGPVLNVSRLVSIDEDPENFFDWSVAKVRIQWHCDDPFWYELTPQTRTFNPSGNTTLTLDAGPGASLKQNLRGQSPVITITSPGFASVTTFQLTNTTDGGLQFRYQDPYLKNGAVSVIDCVNGTVTRDGTNSIQYFEGEFLRLLTESNSLAYVGPACQIDFTWNHRWL